MPPHIRPIRRRSGAHRQIPRACTPPPWRPTPRNCTQTAARKRHATRSSALQIGPQNFRIRIRKQYRYWFRIAGTDLPSVAVPPLRFPGRRVRSRARVRPPSTRGARVWPAKTRALQKENAIISAECKQYRSTARVFYTYYCIYCLLVFRLSLLEQYRTMYKTVGTFSMHSWASRTHCPACWHSATTAPAQHPYTPAPRNTPRACVHAQHHPTADVGPPGPASVPGGRPCRAGQPLEFRGIWSIWKAPIFSQIYGHWPIRMCFFGH